MEKPKHLISPKVAIGAVVVAGLAVVAAIIVRGDAPAPEVRAATPAPEAPAGSSASAASGSPTTAAQAPMPVDDPPPSVPPKIEGVKASAQVGALGVDLQLDVAVSLAGAPHHGDSVSIKASCKLDGEWFSGSAYMRLSKLAAGTNVVQHEIALGRQHAFTAAPTMCQLGFEYTTRPLKREWLAKLCWDGKTVSDKPCATTPNKSVSVSAVRVATSLDRYRVRKVGAPIDLEVSLDAQLARPLAEWSIEVAADCTLPDGTKQSAAERVYTHDVHAGRPFTGRTLLFRRGQQMVDVPESCTVAVEVADRQRLVREPVAAWCWRGGAVAPGACA